MLFHIRLRMRGSLLVLAVFLCLGVLGTAPPMRTADAAMPITAEAAAPSQVALERQVWLPLAHAPAPRVNADAWTMVTLNLRVGPGTEYAVLRTIPAAAQVLVETGPYERVWYHVLYDGTRGYVHGDYLTFTRDLLPDLGMAPLQDIYIESLASGRQLLRFSTIIVNVGAGPFEVRGQRPDTRASEMTTAQRIFHIGGGFHDVPSTAVMFFSGDNHNHWHVRDLQRLELERLDNGSKVGGGAKRGFCFYDNYRYGSTQGKVYTTATNPPACGRQEDLRVTMGLSVGWGDIYNHTLQYQYIDITGLAAGRYRLWATADASDWFRETNNNNNVTWVDLQLQGTTVRIIEYGPAIQHATLAEQ